MTLQTWMIAAESTSGLFGALGGVLEENPLPTLFGLIIGAFGVGFAARKYFQDRELDRTKAKLTEQEERNAAITGRLREVEATEQENAARLNKILGCLAPDELERQLAEPLSQWPADAHKLLVVALMRQLLATPGRAWLCTPSATFFVKIDWDAERNACKFTSETSSQVDPIRELREFAKGESVLEKALLEVALYGHVSVARQTSAEIVQTIVVRQGPGISWNIERQTLERKKT